MGAAQEVSGATVVAPPRHAGRWLALILIAGAALRIATADYSLWLDELASMVFAHQPLDRLWSGWMLRETNPPLFYTMLRGWIGLWGEGDLAVRMLPVTIGMAGIGAIFVLGRAVGGVTTGLIAALLLAASSAHVGYSHELRGYGLTQTGALVALIGAVGFLRDRGRSSLALYVLGAAVALYAHTMLALLVLLTSLGVAVLLRGDRAALVRWIGANLLLAAIWSWWAWISVRQAMMPNPNFGWIERPGWIDAVRMTEAGYLLPPGTGGVLLAGIGAVLVWLARRFRGRADVALLIALVAAAPLALFLISQRMPVFLPRTLFWASGPLIVLVALGIAQASDRRIMAALAVTAAGIVAAGLIGWLPVRESERWDRAAALTAAQAAGRIVMIHGEINALAFAHYAARKPSPMRIVAVRSRVPGADRWGAGLFAGAVIDEVAVRAIVAREGRVLSLGWGAADPLGLARFAVKDGPPLQSSHQPFVQAWRAK